MKNENIDLLTSTLLENIDKCESDDKIKIVDLCNLLKNIKNGLPKIEELENIQKNVIDLEIKYEEFYEISSYFNPLYIQLKKTIHKNEVNKLREENKRKRGIK